jgi:hypothetical protein
LEKLVIGGGREMREIMVHYNTLRKYALSPKFIKELEMARDEYFGAGPVDEDIKGETSPFLSWFILDRPLSRTGKTIVQMYLDENPSMPLLVRQSFSNFLRTVYSLFKVERIWLPTYRLRDMVSDRLYEFREAPKLEGVGEGDILEMRIIPWGSVYYIFGNIQRRFKAEAEKALRERISTAKVRRLNPKISRDIIPRVEI